MELLPTTTTSTISNSTEANEEEQAMGARIGRRRQNEGRERYARRKGKEYCKLLLPLVFLPGKHWIVCLLPRRTRYCATYSRTYPRQESSFSLRVLYLFLLIFSLRLPRRSSATQQRRCCSRSAIALLSDCDCSSMSREVYVRQETRVSRCGFKSLLFAIRSLARPPPPVNSHGSLR